MFASILFRETQDSQENKTSCILRPRIKCISHFLHLGPKIIINERKWQVNRSSLLQSPVSWIYYQTSLVLTGPSTVYKATFKTWLELSLVIFWKSIWIATVQVTSWCRMSSEVGTIEVVFGDDQTGQEIFLYSGQTTTVPSKLYVLLLFKSRMPFVTY